MRCIILVQITNGSSFSRLEIRCSRRPSFASWWSTSRKSSGTVSHLWNAFILLVQQNITSFFILACFCFISPKRLTIEFCNAGSTKMKRGLLQPGQERPMPALSLKLLLPPTDYYITYEGSATTPACQETATWIVFNRPLYITEQQVCHDIALFSFSFFVVVWMSGCNQHLIVVSFSQQLYALRGLKRGSPNPNHNQLIKSSFSSPSLSITADPMGNNYRPIQPTHHRPVRTNIDFTSSEVRCRSRL